VSAHAYLNRFWDVGANVPAHERVADWLGPDAASAAHLGFDAKVRAATTALTQPVGLLTYFFKTPSGYRQPEMQCVGHASSDVQLTKIRVRPGTAICQCATESS